MIIKKQSFVFPTGEKAVIRSAVAQDAEAVVQHRLITAQETYFMARYPEECNYDIGQMKQGFANLANSKRDFLVTAFVGDKVVGDLGLTQLRSNLKYLHRAYMGISVRQEYSGYGLGSLMVDIAVKQAKENGFEQIELGVFSDNNKAIHLYEKFGFEKYGIQPRAFKLKDGTYRDEIIMVKML